MAPQAQTAAPRRGGMLSGSWHGIPKPAIAVGVPVLAYFGIRWYKGKKAASSSSSSTTTAAATPSASTGSSGTGGDWTGDGSGGGGGGGGWTPFGQTVPSTAPVPPDTSTTTTPSGTTTSSTPTPVGIPEVASPAALIGSTPTAGTFDLPKGSVSFQPTAAVQRGKQVAYGIPNVPEASTLEKQGGTVESGAALMKKGWTNLTPGALYLVR